MPNGGVSHAEPPFAETGSPQASRNVCVHVGEGGAWIEHSGLDEKDLAPPDSMVSARHCALPQELSCSSLNTFFNYWGGIGPQLCKQG